MSKLAPTAVKLADYTPPRFLIPSIDLRVELGEERTQVFSTLKLHQNPASQTGPLVLNGEKLVLKAIAINDEPLSETDYVLDETTLTIANPPAAFTLSIHTEIDPKNNTALEGLYRSNQLYCTQCEAEGFRRITYFLDRPDVLSEYTTTVVASRQFPTLLANGNPAGEGVLDDGRHWARWHDPHPKPCYLFALVAGDLTGLSDEYTTTSGRKVTLQLLVEHENAAKCDHAMHALKRSMAWDEQAYGREYDLDVYMIVAVSDFNMGAMENKGLNIFNTQYVLAQPETATDDDYDGITAVIGHEYFHNWSGNRVTCRDWFQLSLKEGFTVFREQQFAATAGAAGVRRIRDVRFLRSLQYPEDAGPTAHPIRPDQYVEINNLYTATVYEKGSEVIRMLHTTLGEVAFRKGTDLYFDRHDGQAVTTEDFVQALEDANGVDLSAFAGWYQQAGTPHVQVQFEHDAAQQTATLSVTQHTLPTPNQPHKQPLPIPIALALLDEQGSPLPLQLSTETGAPGDARVLMLNAAQASWTFTGLATRPVPSLMRGASAPVVLQSDLSRQDRLHLLAHDRDPVACWDAAQELFLAVLVSFQQAHQQSHLQSVEMIVDDELINACRATLARADEDPALIAELLTLPDNAIVIERQTQTDPQALVAAKEALRAGLAQALQDDWRQVYARFQQDTPAARRLKNLALDYLLAVDEPAHRELAVQQFAQAKNMTDALGALRPLSHIACAERDELLAQFYQCWAHEPLVVDKWLTLQGGSAQPQALQDLLAHAAFDLTNPNKVRALLGSFARTNLAGFHAADGAGYRLIADQVLRLSEVNPQVAARLVGTFNRWRKFTPTAQQGMRAALQHILVAPGLAVDVQDIVSKNLAD